MVLTETNADPAVVAEVCDDGTGGILTGCEADCSAEKKGYSCNSPLNLGKTLCTPECDVTGPTYPIYGDFECNDGDDSDPTDGCH